MGQTTIEWTATSLSDGTVVPGYTFNPWIGCTHVSPGCEHCYAETMMDQRYQRVEWGKGKPRVRTSVANWRKPLAWNKAAVASGVRARVFCASLADWLDEEVPIEWLADLLGLIERTPNLDWLLLSKRIAGWSDRLHQVVRETHDGADMFASRWLDGDAPPNVWVGTSCEDQRRADERIPQLLRVPARVRFLSCEPLLGPITFRPRAETPADMLRLMEIGEASEPTMLRGIHWVIAGGESGHGARPMQPDWTRSLRDQCQAAGVSYFFKQWGEWLPFSHGGHGEPKHSYTDNRNGLGPSAASMHRVGKRTAGRLLDGREWNEFPEVPR